MKTTGIVLLTISAIIFIPLSTICIYQAYQFNLQCGDYLKLAGDAPNILRANEYLGKALAYIERTGKTNGNSAIILKTPKHDIGIWYKQILGAKRLTDELIAKGTEATLLENSNTLMKIRETLLDQEESGLKLTHPAYISIVPNQVIIIIFWWICIILMISGGLILLKIWMTSF